MSAETLQAIICCEIHILPKSWPYVAFLFYALDYSSGLHQYKHFVKICPTKFKFYHVKKALDGTNKYLSKI